MGQIQGADEHRREYWAYAQRGAQEATREVARVGAEEPDGLFGLTSGRR
ncbi:MAG: hypothetical protein M3072_05695 [Candidatus Dormibacteraeota bacterium]|nr:hypothetical protein [Candidatus Dormibacteraeota bacterium]